MGVLALASIEVILPSQNQITTYQHQYSEKKMQDLFSNDQTLKLFYIVNIGSSGTGDCVKYSPLCHATAHILN